MPGPIRYFKSDPNDYILVYRNGKVRREGTGIAFFYWAPTTSLASVPVGTIDLPFILNETTGNFQAVTVQGQLTYHVVAPKTMAGILNFVIDPRTRASRSLDNCGRAHRSDGSSRRWCSSSGTTLMIGSNGGGSTTPVERWWPT